MLIVLVEEIAPLARAEVDARETLTAAIEQAAKSAKALGELGTEAVEEDNSDQLAPIAAADATGAYAVRDAALAVKESVDKQQAFHDARLAWGQSLLTPLETTFNDAQQAVDTVDANILVAEAMLGAAKEACKREAFKTAQDRLEK